MVHDCAAITTGAIRQNARTGALHQSSGVLQQRRRDGYAYAARLCSGGANKEAIAGTRQRILHGACVRPPGCDSELKRDRLRAAFRQRDAELRRSAGPLHGTPGGIPLRRKEASEQPYDPLPRLPRRPGGIRILPVDTHHLRAQHLDSQFALIICSRFLLRGKYLAAQRERQVVLHVEQLSRARAYAPIR